MLLWCVGPRHGVSADNVRMLGHVRAPRKGSCARHAKRGCALADCRPKCELRRYPIAPHTQVNANDTHDSSLLLGSSSCVVASPPNTCHPFAFSFGAASLPCVVDLVVTQTVFDKYYPPKQACVSGPVREQGQRISVIAVTTPSS